MEGGRYPWWLFCEDKSQPRSEATVIGYVERCRGMGLWWHFQVSGSISPKASHPSGLPEPMWVLIFKACLTLYVCVVNFQVKVSNRCTFLGYPVCRLSSLLCIFCLRHILGSGHVFSLPPAHNSLKETGPFSPSSVVSSI